MFYWQEHHIIFRKCKMVNLEFIRLHNIFASRTKAASFNPLGPISFLYLPEDYPHRQHHHKNNEAIIDSLFFCSFSTALSERFTSILKSGITTLSPFTTKSEAPEIGLFLGVCTAAIVSLWSLTELLAFFFTTAFHQCYSYN